MHKTITLHLKWADQVKISYIAFKYKIFLNTARRLPRFYTFSILLGIFFKKRRFTHKEMRAPLKVKSFKEIFDGVFTRKHVLKVNLSILKIPQTLCVKMHAKADSKPGVACFVGFYTPFPKSVCHAQKVLKMQLLELLFIASSKFFRTTICPARIPKK